MEPDEIYKMMNWSSLLTTCRFGMENYHQLKEDDRTEFQRDYDRLIFSSPFRRLQNKTQVFPLPGSVFVHNRLTHSLEVACVGRSLGMSVSQKLRSQNALLTPYWDELGSIVSAACLAHDMGNPPFGHAGEKAIASYFLDGNGRSLKAHLTEQQWLDFVCYEGNANAFRLLTHQFNGRRFGGFALTYSTLATVVKYPFAAEFSDPKKQKFGFFTAESDTYHKIASTLGIVESPLSPNCFARHPLVFLLEAADDICYQMMDIEDAHKLRILSYEETKSLFLGFFDEQRKLRMHETLELVKDPNEQIAYLRSCVIGKLVEECSNVFCSFEKDILKGTFNSPLIKCIPEPCLHAYKHCTEIASSKIYCSQDVLDIELAGYKIISTLLDHLVDAVMFPEKAYSKRLLLRVPEQFQIYADSKYESVLAVLDYVSGMTDVYALDLYRKITGISIPVL